MNDYKTCYQAKAEATKARKRAAGRYPTQAQREAARKLTQRGGWANLTHDELVALSTHPQLPAQWRNEFAQRAGQ